MVDGPGPTARCAPLERLPDSLHRERGCTTSAETFADLAREYIERHASQKRSGREDIGLLNGSPHKKKTAGKKPHVPLVTRWGSRKVKDIQRRDVRELLDEIAARAPSWRIEHSHLSGSVWKALDDKHVIISAMFRLRLLTAQRGGEVNGATWAEMDLAGVRRGTDGG